MHIEIREVERDRDVGGVARCWTEYAVVVNGYEEDRYPSREEAEQLEAAFRDGREAPTVAPSRSKRDALAGGPGLDGYIYRAEVLCVDCGRAVILAGPDEIAEHDYWDSEVTPQPIFFGESDREERCGQCGEYLYGAHERDDYWGD